jgi:hypothetical protein
VGNPVVSMGLIQKLACPNEYASMSSGHQALKCKTLPTQFSNCKPFKEGISASYGKASDVALQDV